MTVIDKLHKLNKNMVYDIRRGAYRATWYTVAVNVAIKMFKHHTRDTVTTTVNKGADYITWKI